MSAHLVDDTTALASLSPTNLALGDVALIFGTYVTTYVLKAGTITPAPPETVSCAKDAGWYWQRCRYGNAIECYVIPYMALNEEIILTHGEDLYNNRIVVANPHNIYGYTAYLCHWEITAADFDKDEIEVVWGDQNTGAVKLASPYSLSNIQTLTLPVEYQQANIQFGKAVVTNREGTFMAIGCSPLAGSALCLYKREPDDTWTFLHAIPAAWDISVEGGMALSGNMLALASAASKTVDFYLFDGNSTFVYDSTLSTGTFTPSYIQLTDANTLVCLGWVFSSVYLKAYKKSGTWAEAFSKTDTNYDTGTYTRFVYATNGALVWSEPDYSTSIFGAPTYSCGAYFYGTYSETTGFGTFTRVIGDSDYEYRYFDIAVNRATGALIAGTFQDCDYPLYVSGGLISAGHWMWDGAPFRPYYVALSGDVLVRWYNCLGGSREIWAVSAGAETTNVKQQHERQYRGYWTANPVTRASLTTKVFGIGGGCFARVYSGETVGGYASCGLVDIMKVHRPTVAYPTNVYKSARFPKTRMSFFNPHVDWQVWSEPPGTSIRWLVQFEGSSEYSKWNGVSWVSIGTTLDFDQGNTVTEFVTGVKELPPHIHEHVDTLPMVPLKNDIFHLGLKTTDPAVTPELNGFMFFDYQPYYYPARQSNIDLEYEVTLLSPTTTKIKRLLDVSKYCYVTVIIRR